VKRFFARLAALGLDVRELKGIKIACIGPATAEAVASYHLRVDLIPSRRDAEGLAESFRTVDSIGDLQFLLPRPEIARETLPNVLRESGATVVEAVCYRTVTAEGLPSGTREDLKPGRVDLVTFTSPSTVNGFVQLLGQKDVAGIVKWLPAGCIGPTTTRAAKEAGFSVVAEPAPEQISSESLVEAIAAYFHCPS
jgi:uroporphyrinogen III methyltransferase/synthase